MENQWMVQLCDPDRLTAAEAIRLARQVAHVEPNLARSLGAFVGHLSHAREIDPREMRRALELLYAVSGERSFARTCERVIGQESAVAGSLLRWLASETPRRAARCFGGIS